MDLDPRLPSVALDSFGEGELADLDDRTIHILRMRSGMWDGEGHSQKEVGEELGITKAQVGVLEKEGLGLIRQLCEALNSVLSDLAPESATSAGA